jgi:uncharacterized protein (TIGR03083 family)
MERDELWQVLDAERAGLADLLAGLTPEQWATPSLCTGWTVREVAAHLVLGPETRLGPTLREFVRARGNFDRVVDVTARRRAAEPPEQLVAQLRATVGSRHLAPGQKLLDAVMDVLVHGQDVAVPLGLARPVPPRAGVTAAEHLWGMRLFFHPRKALRGYRLVATDADWSAGSGTEVRGPLSALLPLLAGRPAAALPGLTGFALLLT